jgi:hypothetical protein
VSRHRWTVLTATVAASVAAAATAVTATHHPDPTPATASAAVAAPARTALTAADVDLLFRAEQLLIRSCMAGHGFRYWPEQRPADPDERSFHYVLDDPVWAGVHGYGRDVAQRIEARDRTGPSAAYFFGLAQGAQQELGEALNGPGPSGLSVAPPQGGTLTHSDRGCQARAWQQLYGDAQAWFATSNIVAGLGAERSATVRQSPEFAVAVQTWSSCMRGRGYQVEQPMELRLQVAAESGPATPAEIGAARAEADCAISTGLSATSRLLDRRFDEVLRRRESGSYGRLQQLQSGALPVARQVVAQGGEGAVAG